MSEEQSGESMLAEAEGKIAEALQDEVIVDEPEQEIEGGDISLDEAEETQEAAEPEEPKGGDLLMSTKEILASGRTTRSSTLLGIGSHQS
jgi:hypothetical protein